MKKIYIKPEMCFEEIGEDVMDSWLPIGSKTYDGELSKQANFQYFDFEEEEEEPSAPLMFDGYKIE